MPAAVGRYELVRAIGRGGMAEVFLARRRGAAGIAKRLVVKRVRQDRTSDPRFAEMFLREARVATALSHKNVVTVFDVGRDEEGLFLAMEYVDGPDLGAAIERSRDLEVRFDPLAAAHIAAEVAAGLDHAHRLRDERGGAPLGLVHRDVTPRNVLLSLAGEVKVTDFGVAVAVLRGDVADGRRGTPQYMSPEQARGENVDPRSDLFSLGLVLHELLSGRRLRTGSDKEALLAAARDGEVPALDGETPAELAEIVARATRPDREQRIATARDMQRQLSAWAMGERGRRGQNEPPEHSLASFLAELVPEWSEQERGDGTRRTIGRAGTATLRSIAETAIEDDVTAPPVTRGPEARARRAAIRPIALGALGGLLLIAGAAIFATTRPPRARKPAVTAAAPSPSPSPESTPTPTSIAIPTPAPTTVPPSPPTTAPAAPTTTEPERPARRAAAAPRQTGTLDLNAIPWAYVSIDGGAEQETPVRGKKLAPGRHTVVIRNPVLERRRQMSIQIAAGETSRYVVDLRQ